ncbi:hypothetical protein [Vibrio breoganii]|uniref:hypothetical protein n=1 Tax=Vibrio breoganii TaxID=553239 RepID=UPI000C8661F2|nr:hypothetical protein [Vibrio breoganii]PMK28923.1 hypothetical protein BCU06_16875 [Vibrio breoganii]PMM24934.1 hypothetical protein BCT59_18405 [Vibrio breoganii]
MINIINVSNPMPFGLLFVNYSLLAGIAGGLGVAWALCTEKPSKDYLPQLIAVALALCATFNVLAEVQQQGRLIYGFIGGWENWNGSIIKYGVPAIPLFMGLLLLTVFAPYNALLARLFNPLRSAVVLLGLFLPAYSGIWMMNEHGIALWNSPLSVVLTSLSGLTVGALLFSFLSIDNSSSRKNILCTLLVTNIALLLLSNWWAGRFANAEVLLSKRLLDTHFLGFEWLVLVGFVIALVCILNRLTRTSALIAFISAALGAYFVRYCLLVGGEGVSRSGAGIALFTPDFHEFYFTGASLLLSGGLFAALLLAVPTLIQKLEG